LFLQTERLTLRDWRESDVNHYMCLSHDVGYNCFSLPGRFLVHSESEAKEKIGGFIALFNERRLGKFPIFLKATGEFVGTCGLQPFELDGEPEVELGYRLCLKHWGYGYATEAAAAVLRYGFVDLKLAKIIAFAVPQNRGSLRVLEKLGFKYLRDFEYAGLPHSLHEIRHHFSQKEKRR
jgi:[ribosomal protein S5]-alanine N-acetyltransferase